VSHLASSSTTTDVTEPVAVTAASTAIAQEPVLAEPPIQHNIGKVDVTPEMREEDIAKTEEILKALKPFDGTGDVELFLLRFEHIAQTCHWTEEEQYLYLLQKLSGTADKIIDGCLSEQQTYAEVARRLRSSFSNAKSPEQARLELHSRRQRDPRHCKSLQGTFRTSPSSVHHTSLTRSVNGI